MDNYQNISGLARFIDTAHDAEEIYLHLTRGVCEHSQWDLSSIQVLDQDAKLAIPIVRHDPADAENQNALAAWDARTSPVGKVLSEGKPLILQDATKQDDFPGFRDDAIKRGYHTAVIIPLDVRDNHDRPMVYTVISRKVVAVTPDDLGFLQCVSDLASIAVRKINRLERERRQSRRLRGILDSMTTSLTNSLDYEAAGSLASNLSKLFPSGWLAVDLTSGRGLFDPDTPPPVPLVTMRRIPSDLISTALKFRDSPSGSQVDLNVDGTQVQGQVSPLHIDGNHVGALFFFRDTPLSDNERIAAQAGRVALSSFILRGFVEFRARRVTARRLLSKVLNGDWNDRDELLDEAHQLDFDLGAPCRMLVVRPPAGAPLDDGSHSFILRNAQSTFGPAISSFVAGSLVMLLSYGDTFDQQQRDRFLSRIRPFLPQGTVLVLSEVADDISLLPKIHETCSITLDFARSANATGWVTPLNLGEFPSLAASLDAGKMKGFVGRVLPEPLMAKSRKATVAVETLEMFLRHGRRYQEAADQLGIHVSTLRYRLEQLTDQYGMNFDDPDQCFDLELAIRLRKLENSYDSDEK